MNEASFHSTLGGAVVGVSFLSCVISAQSYLRQAENPEWQMRMMVRHWSVFGRGFR